MYQPPNNASPERAFRALLPPERRSAARESQAAALVALSHSRVENKLYDAMLASSGEGEEREFCLQHLMRVAGSHSYSTVRRALAGLQEKLSIERVSGGSGTPRRCGVFRVYAPTKVFARRRAAGLEPYPKELLSRLDRTANLRAVERVAECHDLTRREAQIALCCIEGMTNVEIGEKLYVSEQTVKSHLRNVFVKMGVRRRTELVSRLLANGSLM